VQVRLLLGPAGSGKTFRCLGEARQALLASPEGPQLFLVAPKQGTYQLEQQLLSTPGLAGYTRLSIVSFESLARSVFDRLGKPVPPVLTEEGRLMVLRSLLTKTREDLKLFRASARLTGFAQQLSQALSELQRAQLSPALLTQLAAQLREEGLSYKLQDLATLLQSYLDWLARHHLQDAEALLRLAAELLQAQPASAVPIGSLWVDGFAEFSELELGLLCALIPRAERCTLTFCLEPVAMKKASWLSHWSMVRKNFERCQKRFGELPNVTIVTEPIRQEPNEGRFSNNPILRHLEQHWREPLPYGHASAMSGASKSVAEIRDSLRLIRCEDREDEVTQAAREILRFVRSGARYRDVSVVVRNLDLHHPMIQRVFSRYEIPFFLDRRESVSHHPITELTRGAVRAAAFGWQHADWFAALKSGLVPAREEDIDLLENEALARGWKGVVWHRPIHLQDSSKTEQEHQRLAQFELRLEEIRRAIVPPFEKFTLALATIHYRPTGRQLAGAIRELWNQLEVQRCLETWAAEEPRPHEAGAGPGVHETVWRQVNAWLENMQLAFDAESLPLREWLPIIETGLANLSVGIIPPALDQVLVGAVDRSRTPEVKLALVLGLNEGIFPLATEPPGLLTESDRLELEKLSVVLRSTARYRLGRESYLGYIACTRAREKLVLTWASQDPSGTPLNPSSVLSLVRQLFPQIEPEIMPRALDWRECQHATELVQPLLEMRSAECGVRSEEHEEGQVDGSGGLNQIPIERPEREPKLAKPSVTALAQATLGKFPALVSLFETLQQFGRVQEPEALEPQLAQRLYGPVLRTSVSRMEQFAACPFKFFVHSGLRAEERKRFELDVKEQGTFQHDVLALFHEQLRSTGKRWRDITVQQAREHVERIARALNSSFREGLLETTDENQFTARVLSESLQDFVETLVDWMHGQYLFDPVAVELGFGEEGGPPAWNLDLGQGQRLQLYGRIDRVDLYRRSDGDGAFCIIVDYKSSHKQLDPVLIQHGLQLQLLMYLNVVRQWSDPATAFGVARLEPAGVFYVNLRGVYSPEPNRLAALADLQRARKLAYRHSGRFDIRVLPLMDCRPGVCEGDQFNYRLTKAGKVSKVGKEAVETADFETLLAQVQNNLWTMGQQIYCGRAEVAPYRKGIMTACDQCEYQSICRVDPWTQRYRVLRRADEESE
jgi:ATP-dependent helicase/nuclease subunit B